MGKERDNLFQGQHKIAPAPLATYFMTPAVASLLEVRARAGVISARDFNGLPAIRAELARLKRAASKFGDPTYFIRNDNYWAMVYCSAREYESPYCVYCWILPLKRGCDAVTRRWFSKITDAKAAAKHWVEHGELPAL